MHLLRRRRRAKNKIKMEELKLKVSRRRRMGGDVEFHSLPNIFTCFFFSSLERRRSSQVLSRTPPGHPRSILLPGGGEGTIALGSREKIWGKEAGV